MGRTVFSLHLEIKRDLEDNPETGYRCFFLILFMKGCDRVLPTPSFYVTIHTSLFLFPLQNCRPAPGPTWPRGKTHVQVLSCQNPGAQSKSLGSGSERRPLCYSALTPLWPPCRAVPTALDRLGLVLVLSSVGKGVKGHVNGG